MSKLSQLMAAHIALLSATACHKNPFGIEYYRRKDDYGSVPTDKQKCRPKEQHEFTSMELKLWQLLRRMLSKSLIIVKIKTYVS